MRISIPVFSCDGCLYCAKTQDGQDACARYQKLINLETDFCSWRIEAKSDPLCANCGNHTEGKAIVFNDKVYCQRCGQLVGGEA